MKVVNMRPEIPLERWAAVLKYRGLDTEALIVAQKRNLEALAEASELVSKGIEELATRQASLFSEQIARAGEILPNLAKQKTLDQVARQQIDFSRESVASAVTGFQELTELLWTCNRQAIEVINRSLMEGLQALLKASPLTNGGNLVPLKGDKPTE